MADPLQEVFSVAPGVWRDPAGHRYLTETAAEARTGVPRSTMRDHGKNAASGQSLRRIDRGSGRRPRFLIPEADVSRFQRLRSVPDPCAGIAIAPVASTADHDDREALRAEIVDLRAEVAQLLGIIEDLAASGSRQQQAVEKFSRMLNSKSGRGGGQP